MRKARLISVMFVMSLLLAACGGKEESSGTKENQTNKNTVFQEETNGLSLEEADINQLFVNGDTLYVEQYVYNHEQPQAKAEVLVEEPTDMTTENEIEESADGKEEIGEDSDTNENDVFEEAEIVENPTFAVRTITGFAMDGTVKSQVTMNMVANCSGGSFAVNEEGNIYSILNEYATYEDGDNTDKVYLASYTADGTEAWKIHINDNIPNGEYFFVNALYCNDKNQLVLDSSRGIEVYDAQGLPVKLIEKNNGNDCRLFKIQDENYALITSDGSAAYIQTLDVQSGVLGERVELPFNYYRYQIFNGKEYDLYLSDEYGIYGYRIGDEELTKVMDYISSDFSYGSLYQVSFVDEDTFFACYYSDQTVLAKFVKVAAENVVEKTELTVGCYYLNHEVKQNLVEFNKKNQEYRLNIKDYSVYDTMDDYGQGLTRLNTDIISGNVPDILLLNTQMPFESFAAKGILADINEFLEKDTELKKEDLLPNILQALSSEDGLYRIAPAFGVTTFVAKTADVGTEPGWTMEEALELLESKPEGTQLLGEVTSANFLYYATWICGEQYVNWDTGECQFDSEGFIKVLEFAGELPKEIDYSTITDEESYWKEMELQYRNGKTLLNIQFLSGFRDYNYTKQAVFGEDITMIGFPTDLGIGAGVTFNNTMAISALSKNQDAAWEFVKTFLMEEYQNSLEYEFPIRVDSLKKMEEKAWEKPYYIDEQGNKQEYDEYFHLNGVEIPMNPMKPEDTAKVMEYIRSLDSICVYDETLYNIIMEEAAGYLEGQKTAEEVAKVIQSRAKIYVSENS